MKLTKIELQNIHAETIETLKDSKRIIGVLVAKSKHYNIELPEYLSKNINSLLAEIEHDEYTMDLFVSPYFKAKNKKAVMIEHSVDLLEMQKSIESNWRAALFLSEQFDELKEEQEKSLESDDEDLFINDETMEKMDSLELLKLVGAVIEKQQEERLANGITEKWHKLVSFKEKLNKQIRKLRGEVKAMENVQKITKKSFCENLKGESLFLGTAHGCFENIEKNIEYLSELTGKDLNKENFARIRKNEFAQIRTKDIVFNYLNENGEMNQSYLDLNPGSTYLLIEKNDVKILVMYYKNLDDSYTVLAYALTVYNNQSENNNEEEHDIMKNIKYSDEKNIQVEFIDYTRDRVYYYEDATIAQLKLEMLQEKYPENEIGISHFSVYGLEIPFTNENIDFIEKTSSEELELIVKIMEMECSHLDSLVDVELYIENSLCYYVISGENSELHAFMEYIEQLGGVEFIQNKEYYFDYEAFKRDCELEGDEEISEMSQDEFEEFCEDCCLLTNELVERYFDFEKLYRDYSLSGMTTIELSNGDYVFVN